MQNDWKDISDEMLNQHILTLSDHGHVTCATVEKIEDLSQSMHKWMPCELALKKLNTPLMQWEPIQSLPEDADTNTLILTQDKRIYARGDLMVFYKSRIPRFPEFTHWCSAPSHFSEQIPGIKLYVGMYGKCRNDSFTRIVTHRDISSKYVFSSDCFQYSENGKCYSPREEDPFDIIAEATKEEYIDYVTREL